MTDVLVSQMTHGRRSFSVLHDPARPPPVSAPLKPGEYRPGLLDEIAALSELRPAASLDELLAMWRDPAPAVELETLEQADPAFIGIDLAGGPDDTARLVPIEAAADACLLIIDHLARDPRDDLDAMVVRLNEAGFGELAGEMVRSVRG